jgi:hypothetical protein
MSNRRKSGEHARRVTRAFGTWGCCEHEETSASRAWSCRGGMPLRRGRTRDRLSCPLGLARPFLGKPAGTRCRLRHLRRQLAQAVSGDEGRTQGHTLRGPGRGRFTQLLRTLRYATVLRTRALTAHGEYSSRSSPGPHWSPSSLPCRHFGAAGLDLHGRKACPAEGISRRRLGASEAKAHAQGQRVLIQSSKRARSKRNPSSMNAQKMSSTLDMGLECQNVGDGILEDRVMKVRIERW